MRKLWHRTAGWCLPAARARRLTRFHLISTQHMWTLKGKIGSPKFICFLAMMMAAQFVIATGHVHLAGQVDEYAWSVSASEDSNRSPGKPHSDHDHFCPLCWAQAGAGSLLLPTASKLLLSPELACAPPITCVTHLTELIAPAAFAPRGPPLAQSIAALARC